MKRTCLATMLTLLLSAPVFSQTTDIILRSGTGRFDIPFQYENNFIVVNVLFNDVFPLRFIFDTGAEHTILTRREITDILQVDYQRRFTIFGADLTTELTAYLATGIKMKMNNLVAVNRSILVLEEDYFRIDEYAGLEIHGIIGADLFRRFVVEIDYLRRVITLIDPAEFKGPKKSFREVPVEIVRHKPYIYADSYIERDSAIRTKYLMDTGAGLAALLYTDTHPKLDLPEHVVRGNLGRGLGGDLQGFVGRIQHLDIGGFQMRGVVANYQEVSPGVDSTYMNNRNGLLGNLVLSRYNITLDYVRNRLYLEPNRKFKRKFKYDRSGLLLAAGGPNLNQFNIFDVVDGSPADKAGVQAGDRLVRINGFPTALLTMESITRKLQKRVGKRIRIVVEREDENLKFVFRLRELI